MTRSKSIAARVQEVLLDGRWIANTNVQNEISQITWQESIQKVYELNSIASLTFHLNYYLNGLLHAFETGKIEMHDKYSFDLPLIDEQKDWDSLVNSFLNNARLFIRKIEEFNDDFLDQYFIDKKYGTNLRNIEGVIEHSYYHLGQIVLIRKLIQH